ncbi:hypothetical protein N431DRAFT_485222 [Stipitochalara longipes BDJ]|nr:hypothetical protein N431DRAFT_485222 [Stipitochalara longipes BDJ]
MVAIKSLISAFAMALAVNAAPSINKARTPGPGQFAVTLRFFPTPDSTCDAGGAPYEVDTVLVPQAGTTETFSTGTCYGQGPYGSVALDGLQSGCTFTEYNTSDCSDTGVEFSASGCQPGNPGFPNYWQVDCE